jgi:hypothetical protein
MKAILKALAIFVAICFVIAFGGVILPFLIMGVVILSPFLVPVLIVVLIKAIKNFNNKQ